MSASDVKLTLGLKTSVVVDGQDVTNSVNFVGIQHEPGRTLPILTLGIRGEVELEGEMEVEYIREATFGQQLAAFFATIDSEKLMKEALEDEDVDRGVAGAIMRALEKRAS